MKPELKESFMVFNIQIFVYFEHNLTSTYCTLKMYKRSQKYGTSMNTKNNDISTNFTHTF